MAWIRRWWKGKLILIIGQSRAGKTTFRDYFEHGIFEDEKDTSKTYEATRSTSFTVKVGRENTLQLEVQSAVELPGQYGSVNHANMAFRHRPHAIIILIDLTNSIQGNSVRAAAAWLEEFCKRYEAK